MIKVLLTGGLGNQLFQYAFGRALAEKNNAELVLNTAYLDSKLPFKKWATPMRYELEVFKLRVRVEHNIISSHVLYPLAKTEYFLRDKINSSRLTLLQEQDHAFHAAYLHAGNDVYVKGNFQSEKYFTTISSSLRNELEFIPMLSGRNAELLQQIQNEAAVSVHIRRGDYISIQKNVGKFAQLPMDYYNRAISYIASRVEQPVLFVFSDDIPWVKEHLQTDYPCIFVENNHTAETAYIDMQLMSACKHQILANSTFSWWGAWLNSNPNKIVVAPQQWFADNRINSTDILPSEWIKL